MTGDAIRFNQTTLEGKELDYIREAVSRGHTSSGGPFTERVGALLNEWFEAREIILTTSCTDALELAALLTEVGPGDEVIVPSFTFVSTALAFARVGADLVFADIEDRFLSLDPDDVRSLITDRTRAIVTVHYAGIGGPIPRLVDLSTQRISLIEDNAHGLFGQASGRKLGTFGRFSTLSFHETKNFTCGEGGALIVNDEADVARAHVLNDKGTNRKAFFDGQVDKYSWQDIGIVVRAVRHPRRVSPWTTRTTREGPRSSPPCVRHLHVGIRSSPGGTRDSGASGSGRFGAGLSHVLPARANSGLTPEGSNWAA